MESPCLLQIILVWRYKSYAPCTTSVLPVCHFCPCAQKTTDFHNLQQHCESSTRPPTPCPSTRHPMLRLDLVSYWSDRMSSSNNGIIWQHPDVQGPPVCAYIQPRSGNQKNNLRHRISGPIILVLRSPASGNPKVLWQLPTVLPHHQSEK